ncbi:hypothetical protein D515_00626 [Grimontia indica]|uniref:Uncharacterized protein n=1 Tax=Grimontia indica TaxID=1056512 RepID=R1GW05_9GAMM|nr:hypothetical protein [Grimontia indica]EOD80338.1 hypothetical protein D515_00626 [Grimontia indica]
MKLATFEEDYWQLRSGVESHMLNPQKFWIPDESERRNLKIGDAAKLIFDVEGENDDGSIEVVGERIYVIVSEIIGEFYIGILDSQPLCIDPKDDFYLGFGVEVAFTQEHVIDIDRPPDDYIEWQLGQKPEKEWPR